jgi:hypothetical protein
VTIRTLRTYIFENQGGVAVGAVHVLMHAAQRVSGQVVIELGIGPYRLPT